MSRLRKSARIVRDLGQRIDLRVNADLNGGQAFFSLEPDRIFPRAAPIEVEIGSGKGDFIIERAQLTPERNFLAIELSGSISRMLAVRVLRSGLPNLRVIRADARPVVNLMLPDASIRAFHIYFPDPWPKSRHSKHRLFTPSLVRGLVRSMEPGGEVSVATDVSRYFEQICALLRAQGFVPTQERATAANRTNFGRKYVGAGRAIYAACFQAPTAAAESAGRASRRPLRTASCGP